MSLSHSHTYMHIHTLTSMYADIKTCTQWLCRHSVCLLLCVWEVWWNHLTSFYQLSLPVKRLVRLRGLWCCGRVTRGVEQLCKTKHLWVHGGNEQCNKGRVCLNIDKNTYFWSSCQVWRKQPKRGHRKAMQFCKNMYSTHTDILSDNSHLCVSRVKICCARLVKPYTETPPWQGNI